jgi:hypothetical protein
MAETEALPAPYNVGSGSNVCNLSILIDSEAYSKVPCTDSSLSDS